MPLFGPRRPPPLTGEGGVGRNRGRLVGTALGAIGVPFASLIGRMYDRRRNERLENQIYGPQRPNIGGQFEGYGPVETNYNQTGYVPGMGQPFTGQGTNFGFNYANPSTPGLPDYGQPNPSPTEQQMQSGWAQLFRPSVASGPSGPRGGRTTQSAGARNALTGAAAQSFVEGAQQGSGNLEAQRLLAMMGRGNDIA